VYTYGARLVRVIDADTVVLDLDLGFYQHRLGRSYRLARINAPEMSTPEGVAARDALVAHLAGVTSYLVSTSKADSFDRWIVELYADGANVSDWLVANSFAIYHTYR
jgi:endonuclease YncB( thermonuclease family)